MAGGRARGWVFALLVLAAPFVIFYAVFTPVVGGLTPDAIAFAAIEPSFVWEGADALAPGEVLARDLAARYRFALASAGLMLAAAGSAVVAAAVILRPSPGWVWGAALAFAVAGGAMGFLEERSNPLRAVAADCSPAQLEAGAVCPLNRAAASPGSPLDAAALALVQAVVTVNAVLGTAATGLLVGCLFALAMPDRRAAPPAEDLRHRRGAFFLTLGAAAALLSFGVATTHGFYHWAAALVQPPADEQLSAFASGAALYWGALFSAVTVAAAAASAAGIGQDIRRAAAAEAPDHAGRTEWEARHGLAFQPLRAVGAAAMAAGPLLTSPILDVLRGAVP